MMTIMNSSTMQNNSRRMQGEMMDLMKQMYQQYRNDHSRYGAESLHNDEG
jgi:hypothetical protein